MDLWAAVRREYWFIGIFNVCVSSGAYLKFGAILFSEWGSIFWEGGYSGFWIYSLKIWINVSAFYKISVRYGGISGILEWNGMNLAMHIRAHSGPYIYNSTKGNLEKTAGHVTRCQGCSGFAPSGGTRRHLRARAICPQTSKRGLPSGGVDVMSPVKLIKYDDTRLRDEIQTSE